MSINLNLVAKQIQRKYKRRVRKSWNARFQKPAEGVNPYTGLLVDYSILMLKEEELKHILKLNRRCLSLTRKLIKDIDHISHDMYDEIMAGHKLYKNFVIMGYIYVEVPYYENEIFKHLEGVEIKSELCFTSEKHPNVVDERFDCEDFYWFGNWEGHLCSLYEEREGKGIKLCTAFCELFDWSELFTIEELMEIQPKDILPHIDITI